MDGTIRVYTADVGPLAQAERFHRLYRRVSAQRREKVDHMRFDRDKRLSLGAGALLEAALAAEGVRDFTTTTVGNGKPCLARDRDIHFNLSHSGTKVMCAISDSEIGCDVEQVNEIDLEIARRFFCPEEYAALRRADPALRIDLFFRYWTLKESFVKATGLGFELAPDRFCILVEGSRIAVRHSVDARAYYFQEFELNDGYKYALCSVNKPTDAAMTRIDWESL